MSALDYPIPSVDTVMQEHLAKHVKKNCSFTFPSNHFDVVHSQLMAGGIRANRWQSYLKDIYRVLQPGGWCQMVELYLNAQSDNGTLSPGTFHHCMTQCEKEGCLLNELDHALSRWSSGYLDAMHPQKDPRAALRLKDWMTNAGFVDIESRLLTLPMCPWPIGMPCMMIFEEKEKAQG